MRAALTENQSDQTRATMTAYATPTPLPGYAGAWTYTNLVTEKSNQQTTHMTCLSTINKWERPRQVQKNTPQTSLNMHQFKFKFEAYAASKTFSNTKSSN